MNDEQTRQAQQSKREAITEFQKLGIDIQLILSQKRTPGYRHRDALRNSAEIARLRYGDIFEASGLTPQSLSVVEFTILLRHLPLRHLLSVHKHGIPDCARDMISAMSLPKFWHDCHDQIRNIDPELGERYLLGTRALSYNIMPPC